MFMKVTDCPAVRSIMTFEFPFSSQDIFHKIFMCTAGFSVCPVISTHYSLNIRFCYKRFKSRKICFPHILHACLCIKFMSERFRTAVHCIMLCTCCRFHYRSVTLDSFYEFHAKSGRQIWILTIGFMPSAPSRISENVYIGGPESKTLVNIPVFFCRICIVFCSSLSCNDIANFFHLFIVKYCSHRNCLWEHGCHTCSGHSMQCFIPVIVCRNTQSFHGSSIVF